MTPAPRHVLAISPIRYCLLGGHASTRPCCIGTRPGPTPPPPANRSPALTARSSPLACRRAVDPTPPNTTWSSTTVADLFADVVVVGAGPAGTSAAITLARQGRSVVVIDKAVFPRDKCCGDGLTTLALRELDHLGLDPTDVPDWFDVTAAALRSPSGREVVVPAARRRQVRRRHPAAPARRRPRAPGPHVTASTFATVTRFRSIDQQTDHVVVHADGLRITARFVVAADGMWSPVRKALGAGEPGYLGEWHGFRQYATQRHRSGGRAALRVVRAGPHARATRGRSRSRTDAPTSASGCSATANAGSRAMKADWDDLLATPAHRRRARRRLRVGGSTHRVADPGTGRSGRADVRTHAVRRRRGDGRPT